MDRANAVAIQSARTFLMAARILSLRLRLLPRKTGLPSEALGSLAAQPSMKFWAGLRYYRRHDIHINDFFFYNMSGGGGGVEDFELLFGKMALAWIGPGAGVLARRWKLGGDCSCRWASR